MPVCPKCNAAMDQLAVRCPECGYDFPETALPKPPKGWAYSPLADMALWIGAIAAGLGCASAIYGALASSLHAQAWHVVADVVKFFLCFAMLVVFVRVGKDRQ